MMRLAAAAIFFLLLVVPDSWAAESGFPSFKDDLDRESLRFAIQRSLDFLGKLPPERVVGDRPRKLTAQEIRESLLAFLDLLEFWDRPGMLREAIRSRFDLFPSMDEPAEILLTGYYQPVIEGSLTPSQVFRFPVYGKPKDLVEAEIVTLPDRRAEKIVGLLDQGQFVPYFSRDEIDRLGALKGKGYEIAWVKDPVNLFFLHIQGSGLLKLEDGRLVPVNYAASNGRPYKSIGRVLIDSGKISEGELSMQRLRRYLTEHPEERDALFAQNERYVFFRFVKEGPLGSLEVPLTPGRSLATDAQFFPQGALAFVAAERPVLDTAGNLVGWQPFSRFVVNQDTGSAIQGPKRADLYFGSGDAAGSAAGFLKSTGRLFILVKKKSGP
jgi:membrane-bound lytic murein transglycosylase A